jgi:Flp pilus assembly pilin Flp
MGRFGRCRFEGMALDRRDDRTLKPLADESAQTMAEYAVVLGVITPAVILVIALLSGNVADLFNRVAALF